MCTIFQIPLLQLIDSSFVEHLARMSHFGFEPTQDCIPPSKYLVILCKYVTFLLTSLVANGNCDKIWKPTSPWFQCFVGDESGSVSFAIIWQK